MLLRVLTPVLALIVIVITVLSAYPFPYRDLVSQAALESGLDKYLIISVIKVESSFNPKAVSQEGARGLMQIMPGTGRWLAEELGFGEIDNDDLFRPEVNIKIGTVYLSSLIAEFNGNLLAAVAAYNCGQRNVKKWISLAGGDITLDEIPFPETREFVRRVLRNYWWYSRIYNLGRSISGVAAVIN